MEKIKNISITNFKSIKHLEINDCKKINVFIGMPNTGKSNILEALGLFGKISQSNTDELNKFVRFNVYTELFFEKNTNEIINIKINDNELLISTKSIATPKNKGYLQINEHLKYDNTILNNMLELEENPSIKKYSFLNSIFNENKSNEFLNYPNGENLVQIVSSHKKLRSIVNNIFKENSLKLLFDKNSNEIGIFKEYQDGTFYSLSYNLIADTLQRLIFYKAAIMSNQDSVLLFEEPEAHCFEPYIIEFTNAVKYDENNNQFFIVTHSEYILQEFLRDEESKKNTNIYLVNNIDGETKVKLLDKDNNDDVYEFGMNPFFNFENLWENN